MAIYIPLELQAGQRERPFAGRLVAKTDTSQAPQQTAAISRNHNVA
jgi:hypothetical protein